MWGSFMQGLMGSVHVRARKRIGTTLRGKYLLEGVLGVGAMASVYAATHRNKKRFAVKILHTELSLHDDIRARFLREGYVANSVGHPGAVAVIDDDIAEDGSAFLVMELLEGHTLDVVWNCHDRRLALSAVLCATSQILEILAAAHAKNVVHRDIKPANLFLTRDGAVKILDFGIARLRDDSSAAVATRSGVTLGTPAFMSPEQAGAPAREIDGLSDVWAVGATMFTLLTGHHVHKGQSSEELVVDAASVPARSIATIGPRFPPGVVAVVDKALAFAKEDRWPSALAMRDAVDAAFRELPTAATPPADLFRVILDATDQKVHELAGAQSLSPVSTTAERPERPSGQATGPTVGPPISKRRSMRTLRLTRSRKRIGILALALCTLAVGVGTRWLLKSKELPPPAAPGEPTSHVAAAQVPTPVPAAASSVAPPAAMPPSSSPAASSARPKPKADKPDKPDKPDKTDKSAKPATSAPPPRDPLAP